MKKLLFLLFFVILCSSGYSQLLRVHSSKNISVYQSFNQYGFFSSASFGYFISNKLKISPSISYGKQNIGFTPVNHLNSNFQVLYPLYNFNEKVFLDVSAGVILGYEFSKNELLGKYNQFYVGELVGLQAEYIILPYLSAGLSFKQNFIHLSKTTSAFWDGSIFISYNF